jgi:hypothetical protein
MLTSMVNYVSFSKTLLLIIVREVAIDDWDAINKSVLIEKNKKCCIDIVKKTNNLRQFFFWTRIIWGK